MGGEPYQYVVDYDPDFQKALETLRADVFARGAYTGAEARPKSPKEALENSGATGTQSILDILNVSPQPTMFCAAPLTDEEISRFWDGQEPTVASVEVCDELWDSIDRGTARIVTIKEAGIPKKLMFVGYSFD